VGIVRPQRTADMNLEKEEGTRSYADQTGPYTQSSARLFLELLAQDLRRTRASY
jgi:hypothetical protein